MRSGFFNSNIDGYDDYGNPIYDRAEEASFFAAFFADFIGNGIYPNPSTGMQVVSNSGMELMVYPGRCFINGYRGVVEENGESIAIESADTSYSRIDRVVARLTIEERRIKLAVLKGEPATVPIAKDLTRNSNIYEIALADVLVNKNASVITQANITDTRLDTSICGIVTGVIEQVDTTTIFNQYKKWFENQMEQADIDYTGWFEGFTSLSEEAFTNWFNNIKGQLSEDAAGKLQNEFEELKEAFDELAENANQSDGVPIGTGMDYFGTEAPEGYLFADGAEISRTEYSELYQIIGTIYGEGDGETTFNLPDKRERVSVMHKEGSINGTKGATLDTLGAKGGEFKHVLSKEELPNYNLTVNDPGHSHALARVIEFSVGNNKYGPAGGTSQAANISTFSAKTGITVSSGGNDVPMNNLQPYLVCNYIIKVK